MEFEKIDWSKPAVAKLLELWEGRPNLYNPKHGLYFNKHAKHDALQKITQELQDVVPNITQAELQKKLTNLRSQYTHEKQKILEKKKSGAGADEQYVPSAFWFKNMSFLDQFIRPRKSKSNFEMVTVTDPEPSTSRSQSIDNISFPDDIEEIFLDDSSSSILSPPPTKKSRRERDDTAENIVLREASEAIRSVISATGSNRPTQSEFSPDVETFGQYIKAELQELPGNFRDEAKSEFFQILIKIKNKSRENL